MFNKLSFKIGILFFVFILIIETFLFYGLYITLANDRINEAMTSLQTRGNSHRNVLEDHFDEQTLEHVAIMEAATELSVVITDKDGMVYNASESVNQMMEEIIDRAIKRSNQVYPESEVIENNWQDSPYIVTNSSIIIDDKLEGHVYMFIESDYIKRMINKLNQPFLIVGLITLVVTVLFIMILSKGIANPLIKMKEATKELSKGKHTVKLNTGRKDELGDLAMSITTLATDLKRLQLERNEFLASVSHELRTPITYIKGYADLIVREDSTFEEKKTYINIIREEIDELTVLINHLFDLAKRDENLFLINSVELNFSTYLDQIIDRIQSLLITHNIKLKKSYSDHLITRIDPERFQQVLMNILNNAINHSEQDTLITVSVTEDKKKTILRISDEGEGIPEEDMPYLFDRLYRVEKSRTRARGGSGLGLSIVKEIVEAHGGHVDITSNLGEGTEVAITLFKRRSNHA